MSQNVRRLVDDKAQPQQHDKKTKGPPRFPPQCTVDQMDVLKRQLPPGGCEKRKDEPYQRMDCSFSAATACGDYPKWLHEFHANHDVVLEDETAERFQAVMVGCNKAHDAVNLLRVASRDRTNRYDWIAWRSEFLRTDDPVDDATPDCPRSDVQVPETRSPQKAQAYCIEAMPKTFRQLERTKTSIGYSDEELELAHLAVRLDPGTTWVYSGDPIVVSKVGPGNWRKKCSKFPDDCVEVTADKIDNWIRSKPGLVGDAPIHYLSIAVDDNAYEVLQGASKTLSRVHYMDFSYHWFGDWGRKERSLKELIARLKKKGHLCYFHGNDDNLWRITDCWQDHYELHFFANIACVDAYLPAAQPLQR